MKRDEAIDILKCIAILLILNAHSKELFGRWEMLSTGGVIGNSLFFFCSGFTLSLKKINLDFFNWYKRRIARILPSLFCWALLLGVIGWGGFGENSMINLVTGGGLWFISCILVYYILLYWHCRYMEKYTEVLFVLNIIAAFFVYLYAQNRIEYVWDSPVKFVNYFTFMLLGIIFDKHIQRIRYLQIKKWQSGSLALLCLVLWLGRNFITSCQILSMIPLLGLTFFSYLVFNTETHIETEDNKCYKILMVGVRFISNLTLEIYIVQATVLHIPVINIFLMDYIVFPFRIIFVILLTIVIAFVLRIITRFWVNTFEKEKYNWRHIISFS